jgi:hypothetical protein
LEEEKAVKLSQEIETLRMEKEADEKQKEDKAGYKIAKKKAKEKAAERVTSLEKEVVQLKKLVKQAKADNVEFDKWAKVKEQENENFQKQLSKVMKAQARTKCSKQCTAHDCPMNHGGLTDLQEEKVQEAKRLAEEKEQAKAQAAQVILAQEVEILRKTRADEIKRLQVLLDIAIAAAKGETDPPPPTGGGDTSNPHGMYIKGEFKRDVRDVKENADKAKSDSSGTKERKDTTSESAQPDPKKEAQAKAKDDRVASEAADGIIASLGQPVSRNEADAGDKAPSPTSPTLNQEKAAEEAADQEEPNLAVTTSSTTGRANCINSGGHPADGSNSSSPSGGGERASSVLLAMEGQNDQ